jgi:hypothetical protein
MASIRKLKKEIDARVFEVISDCLTYSEIHADNKTDEVTGIISDTCNFRNDLIHRVNNPELTADQKGMKVHYQLIRQDLDAGVDKLFDRLSSVSKKKKK